ncbi:MAG: glutamate racemase [candidate division WOR-3 bacterium]
MVAEAQPTVRNPRADAPIGVFDSGIGGLTVVRALRALLPAESIIYFGDTARVPYGTKSAETITRFAQQDARFLVTRGVKLIIVACHSASSAALLELRRSLMVPVIGVVEPGARALVAATRSSRVAVIGTTATILSAAYERAIRALRPDIEVVARATPLLVPMAEEGWGAETPADSRQSAADALRTRAAELVCRYYLGGLVDENVDALLLGCTHFPLLAGIIARVVGPGIRLVDASQETARAAAQLLQDKGLLAPTGPSWLRVYLSDLAPSFEVVGTRFLGAPLGEVTRASVGDGQ